MHPPPPPPPPRPRGCAFAPSLTWRRRGSEQQHGKDAACGGTHGAVMSLHGRGWWWRGGSQRAQPGARRRRFDNDCLALEQAVFRWPIAVPAPLPGPAAVLLRCFYGSAPYSRRGIHGARLQLLTASVVRVRVSRVSERGWEDGRKSQVRGRSTHEVRSIGDIN